MEFHAPPAEVVEGGKSAESPADTLSTPQKVAGIISLSLGVVLFALDGTMVTTAVPRMVAELGGADLLSWIGTAYLLTSTAFGPLWGKLGDLLGRKMLFLVNILIFVLASLICALAQNMITLVVGRAIQGLGGGGMQALVYVLMADVVTLRERGTYQALMGSIAGLSAIIGPLLGGVITDQWSWRGIFWINLPVGTIAIVVSWFALKIPLHENKNWKATLARVDYAGAFLCIAGVVLFLFGLTSGITASWTSAQVIAPLVLGIAVFAGFIVWEAKFAKEPNVPVGLFKLRNIPFVYAATLFSGWNLQAAAYFIPLAFQLIYGNTPTQSGLKTIAQIGSLIPVSIIIGILTTKTGIYVPYPKIGMAIMAVGIGLCATWTATSPLGMQIGYLVILGVGAGFTLSVLMLMVQANLPTKDVGPGTTMATFLQTIGGVLGIATSGAIMQSLTAQKITPEAIGGIAMTYQADPSLIVSTIRGMTDGIVPTPQPGLSADAIAAIYALVQDAYVYGLSKAFILVACATAVGWVCVLFVRHTALRTTMDDGKDGKKEGNPDDEELQLDDVVVDEDGKAVAGIDKEAVVAAEKAAEVNETASDATKEVEVEEDVAATATEPPK